MELNRTILKRNAVLLYGVVILLGTVLSGFVFTSTQNIKNNALNLVDYELQIFEQLQHLNTLFVEQELFLNEYYANQNRNLYTERFIGTAKSINQKLAQLKAQGQSIQEIEQLEAAQAITLKLAADFDANMVNGDKQNAQMWNTARQQLASYAGYRGEIKQIIDAIGFATSNRITKQTENTKKSLNRTIQIVLVYSVVIIVIAILVGQAIKTAITVSHKNKRLALFPERNPNPILSLDIDNNSNYVNPAMATLLSQLNMSTDMFVAKFSNQINKTQKSILDNGSFHDFVELSMNNMVVNCDVHWLPDIQNWDLHLNDVTEKKRTESQLLFQAFHDQETGLFNKNQLIVDLETMCLQQNSHAIGFLEVRNYSRLVSRLGLQSTTAIIEQLANILKSELCNLLDTCDHNMYRTSDKQFAIIVSNNDCEEEVKVLVDKIECLINSTSFLSAVKLEIDFGFVCYPHHASDVQSIIKSATIALDAAIAIEHASLFFYSQALGESVSKEIELTNNLSQAIDNQELELYFQPQLDIQKNVIVGVETLIRWQSEGSFISPIEFIPLAEKSGLIVPLGNWILLNACHKAAELIALGHTNIVVAINISPQQFNHPDFYQSVLDSIKQSNVPAENIELEITEGVIMYNEDDTINLLNKLKKTGVKLSIDDFGTGYSSLSYLKQFPIDKLKIDQSFIRQINENNDDKAIVSTIIDLGNNLNLKLIAEGVEELSQLEILQHLGCQEIQGYYFSRPLASDKLNNFLQEFNKQQANLRSQSL